jgi:hypothetical protein
MLLRVEEVVTVSLAKFFVLAYELCPEIFPVLLRVLTGSLAALSGVA